MGTPSIENTKGSKFQSSEVSKFLGFKVLKALGFPVSWFIGSLVSWSMLTRFPYAHSTDVVLCSLCPPRRWSDAGVGIKMLSGIPLLSAN